MHDRPLAEAMARFLDNWSSDLPAAWRPVFDTVQPDFSAMDPDLDLEIWEPIFPPRRGQHFPGMPPGAHMLRAFDGIAPADVKCLILGQDPYPEPGFATGRAFEAGNVAQWQELDKMFSRSIRAFMQLIVAARTGEPRYARSFADWPATLAAMNDGSSGMEPPTQVADRWVAQGVLLINASFTLTRFDRAMDPHQSRGHLPMWRPVMLALLRFLLRRGTPLVLLGFGDIARDLLREAGAAPGCHGLGACVLRDHPARADEVLALENPFVLCNAYLARMGATPISW